MKKLVYSFLSLVVVLSLSAGCQVGELHLGKSHQHAVDRLPQTNEDTVIGAGGNSGSGGSSGSSSSDDGTIISSASIRPNCNSTVTGDFRDVLNAFTNHWSSFESYASSISGIRLSGCLQRRLSSNGTVSCVESGGAVCGANIAGKALPGLKTIAVCSDWMNLLQEAYSSETSWRRVCFGSLIAHEFSHTCGSIESRAELIEDAALAFLNNHYGTSLTNANCNLD